MIKKSVLSIFLISLMYLLFVCGIGRDDVPLSKYYRFANNPVFDCVGQLTYKNGLPGSCVLIDKRFIITAAHSFIEEGDSLVQDSIFVGELNIWKHRQYPAFWFKGKKEYYTVKFASKEYKIKNIFIHHFYTEELSDTMYAVNSGKLNQDCEHYDIAIAELTTVVDNAKPAILNEDEDELGKRAIIAGFGEVERADEFNADSSIHERKKMGGENMVDSIGGFKLGDKWAALVTDFDAPNSVCCNRIGSAKPLPLEWYADAGDCGCGLFINKNGIWKLAGICSSSENDYEMINYGKKFGKYYGFTDLFQRISVYKDWIKETIKSK